MLRYIFEDYLRVRNKQRNWLAASIGVSELTLNTKFFRNKFSVEDVFLISDILNIPLDILHKVYFEQKKLHLMLETFLEKVQENEFIYLCVECKKLSKSKSNNQKCEECYSDSIPVIDKNVAKMVEQLYKLNVITTLAMYDLKQNSNEVSFQKSDVVEPEEENPYTKIVRFLEKRQYNYTVSDVQAEYQKKISGYYVSYTMDDCLKNLEKEILSLISD